MLLPFSVSCQNLLASQNYIYIYIYITYVYIYFVVSGEEVSEGLRAEYGVIDHEKFVI